MEEIKYNWILVYKDTKVFIGWSKAKEEPKKDPLDRYIWVKWGKELPEMAEGDIYIYKSGKLTKK